MTMEIDENEPLVGHTLVGRYDVLELLGEGGMGAVYRVLDRELEETVALKVIRRELAGGSGIAERFRNEVKLARRVTHGNVARTFELGHVGSLLYCTMELVHGESLAHMLARRGRLPVAEAAAIVAAVCEGLEAAHVAGVIHRDIKPANVLVADTGRVVLTDFGVAAVVAGEGDVAGTPEYMAPEQAHGEPPTPAADVYAVGVLLYELTTGQRAFSGDLEQVFAAKREVPRLVVASADVPIALADVIGAATEREPGLRIATAKALAAALAPWVAVAAPSRAAAASEDPHGIATIVVPPPDGAERLLYVAEAVHSQLLDRLVRVPRVRVKTHDDTTSDVMRIALRVDDALAVAITGPGNLALTLQMPLAVEHVAAVADAITAALVGSLAPDPSPAASDLLLRARHVAHGEFARYAASLDLLERAATLAPADPQIAAALGLANMQHAFFTLEDANARLASARELVRVALAAGPDRSESHLAAGQLELHTGDAATAAGHFRIAIACAPHSAMAHEQLGRMLLEAGHLEPGYARLDEALALAPHLTSARWQIARAYALEQQWGEYDRLVATINPREGVIGPLRLVCWRGDRAWIAELREQFRANPPSFERELFESVFAVVCDGEWAKARDPMLEHARDTRLASRRRRALVAQVVAEAAGIAGDHAISEAMIAKAIADGLFDLHWLDRCPALAGARARSGFAALRAEVVHRANTVLDALYGDHPVQTPGRTQAHVPMWLMATSVR